MGLTELSHPAYSSYIAPSDYHLFSNAKNFLRGRNCETDHEAIMTVNDYLESCLVFFLESERCRDP